MTATSGLNRCRLRLSGSVAGATLVRRGRGIHICRGPIPTAAGQPRETPGQAVPAVCPGPGTHLPGTGFWENLSSAALTGQRSAFSSRRSLPAKEEREAFLRLAAVAPDHVAHSRTVTALALRLFDDLAPLHGLSRRDRTLLSYAATVHDIGWIHGQAGHQKESAGMILASPSLPVPVRRAGDGRSRRRAPWREDAGHARMGYSPSLYRLTRNGCAHSPHSSALPTGSITSTPQA